MLSKDHKNKTDFNASVCGVNYCPSSSDCGVKNETEEKEEVDENFKVDRSELHIIAGAYLACAIASALIVIFLVDPLSRFGEGERDAKKSNKLSGAQLLIATFKHMTKPIQIFIIPLTIWSGMEQGFFFSDYTAVSPLLMYIKSRRPPFLKPSCLL